MILDISIELQSIYSEIGFGDWKTWDPSLTKKQPLHTKGSRRLSLLERGRWGGGGDMWRQTIL